MLNINFELIPIKFGFFMNFKVAPNAMYSSMSANEAAV